MLGFDWVTYTTNACSLQVWNCMLSEDVFKAADVCQDAWTDICCQAVKQRVDPVSKITAYCTNAVVNYCFGVSACIFMETD